jgi:hypothetical protein
MLLRQASTVARPASYNGALSFSACEGRFQCTTIDNLRVGLSNGVSRLRCPHTTRSRHQG